MAGRTNLEEMRELVEARRGGTYVVDAVDMLDDVTTIAERLDTMLSKHDLTNTKVPSSLYAHLETAYSYLGKAMSEAKRARL